MIMGATVESVLAEVAELAACSGCSNLSAAGAVASAAPADGVFERFLRTVSSRHPVTTSSTIAIEPTMPSFMESPLAVWYSTRAIRLGRGCGTAGNPHRRCHQDIEACITRSSANEL
jgi:hypothetical protein